METGTSSGRENAFKEGGETEKFEVVFPDGLTFAFDAYVATKFSGASVGEQVKFTAR